MATDPVHKLSGEVSYSPENGVIFEYQSTSNVEPGIESVVYGSVAPVAGEDKAPVICTLRGRAVMSSTRISHENTEVKRRVTEGVSFVVFGVHEAKEATYKSIRFKLPYLHSFFSSDSPELTFSSPEPLCTASTEQVSINISHANIFYLFKQPLHMIASQVTSGDPLAMEELTAAIDQVEQKFPRAFHRRKSLSYTITINFSEQKPLKEAYDVVSWVAQLFTLLSRHPVIPDKIWINGGEGQSQKKIYPSTLRRKETLQLASSPWRNCDLPINNREEPLYLYLGKWLDMYEQEKGSDLLESWQTMTGLTSLRETRGNIVLYATKFEQIAREDGVAYESRYQHPLDLYGSPELKKVLSSCFAPDKSLSSRELGRTISELRNDIAHTGKPPKWAHLSHFTLSRIVHCMELVIASYMLVKIGVSQNGVTQYLKKHTPPLQ